MVRRACEEQVLEKVRRLLPAAGKVPVAHVDGQSHGNRVRPAAGLQDDPKPVVER